MFLRKDIQKNIITRLREKGHAKNYENFAYEITTDEIMELIGCSKRTAEEYKKAIRIIGTGLF